MEIHGCPAPKAEAPFVTSPAQNLFSAQIPQMESQELPRRLSSVKWGLIHIHLHKQPVYENTFIYIYIYTNIVI